MSDTIAPQYTSIDGLAVRFTDSGPGERDVLLLSPWPESIFAFQQMWGPLSQHARLVAVDPPGFGKSEARQSLMNPQSMGEFIAELPAALGLTKPHVVAPDIGTSSALFAAAAHPDMFASLVIGSGGASVPLNLTGALEEWVEAPDLQPYRDLGGRKVVDIVLTTIEGYTPSPEIVEDYRSGYEGDRFADTIPYAKAYREQLPILGELLPEINTPVRIVQGSVDQVVPQANAVYLHERLPNSKLDFIEGAGHFCWEERPEEYARLALQWWQTAR